MQVYHSAFSFSQKSGEGEEVPGLVVAQTLFKAIGESGNIVRPPEIWRDVGWMLDCKANGCEFQLHIAEWGRQSPQRILLAIEPQSQQSWLGRLFRRDDGGCAAESENLARVVHDALSTLPGVEAIRWSINAHPDKSPSATPTPTPRRWQ